MFQDSSVKHPFSATLDTWIQQAHSVGEEANDGTASLIWRFFREKFISRFSAKIKLKSFFLIVHWILPLYHKLPAKKSDSAMGLGQNYGISNVCFLCHWILQTKQIPVTFPGPFPNTTVTLLPLGTAHPIHQSDITCIIVVTVILLGVKKLPFSRGRPALTIPRSAVDNKLKAVGVWKKVLGFKIQILMFPLFFVLFSFCSLNEAV